MLPMGPSATSTQESAIPAARTQPYLLLPEPNGRVQHVTLREDLSVVTIGRREGNDIVVSWDPNVSRTHAELRRVGAEWTLVDDGLSRNGTTVNGQRATGRRRLRDGDVIQVGFTQLTYRNAEDAEGSTVARGDGRPPPSLTETQRRVLAALCRPCLDPRTISPPATNEEIAHELFLSVAGVKTHLRSLFTKFEIGDLPHHHKRTQLVAKAIERGALTP